MSDSYEFIRENEEVEKIRLKAQTIIKDERLMTWRGKEKDMTKDNFSDYMLVLAPKDRKEPVWGGVSGQISEATKAVQSVGSSVIVVDQKLDQLIKQAEPATESGVVDVQELTDKVDTLAAEMLEMKGMIKTLIDSHNV